MIWYSNTTNGIFGHVDVKKAERNTSYFRYRVGASVLDHMCRLLPLDYSCTRLLAIVYLFELGKWIDKAFKVLATSAGSAPDNDARNVVRIGIPVTASSKGVSNKANVPARRNAPAGRVAATM